MMANAPFVPTEESDDTPTTKVYTGTVEEQAGRDAMVAAAREAIEADAKENGRPAGESADDIEGMVRARRAAEEKTEEKPKAKPADQSVEKPKGKEGAPTLSDLAKTLRQRERAREAEVATQRAATEAEQILASARQQSEEVERMRAEAQRDREEAKAFLDRVRRQPTEALKEVGWKPDDFIDASLNEKDPNYQRYNEVRGEIQKRDQQIDELRSTVKELASLAKQWQDQGRQQSEQAEIQTLFGSIPEDSPVWKTYEDQDDILYQANKVRRAYHQRTGKLASAKEIGEYLHWRELEKSRTASQQTREQKPAGKTKANGSRALGNSDASESRGANGAKAFEDMEGDEQRAYMIEVANAAIASGTE